MIFSPSRFEIYAFFPPPSFEDFPLRWRFLDAALCFSFTLVVHLRLRQTSRKAVPRPSAVGAAPGTQERVSRRSAKSRGFYFFFREKKNVVFFTEFLLPVFFLFEHRVFQDRSCGCLFHHFLFTRFSRRARRRRRRGSVLVVAVDVVVASVVPLSLGPFAASHFFFCFLFFFFFLRRRGTRAP